MIEIAVWQYWLFLIFGVIGIVAVIVAIIWLSCVITYNIKWEIRNYESMKKNYVEYEAFYYKYHNEIDNLEDKSE